MKNCIIPKNGHNKLILFAASLLTLIFVNCSRGGGGSSNNSTATTVTAAIANRCAIGILKCGDPTLDLPAVLANSNYAVSLQACLVAAQTLRAKCKLPYPVPVTFSNNGVMQSNATVY